MLPLLMGVFPGYWSFVGALLTFYWND